MATASDADKKLAGAHEELEIDKLFRPVNGINDPCSTVTDDSVCGSTLFADHRDSG